MPPGSAGLRDPFRPAAIGHAPRGEKTRRCRFRFQSGSRPADESLDYRFPTDGPEGLETWQEMVDPKELDLSCLSLAELRQLSNRIESEIFSRQEAGKVWLRQHGLVEKRGPLYRNPRNAAETWSGRGGRPAWVESALAEGYTLESLATETDPDLPAPSRRGPR